MDAGCISEKINRKYWIFVDKWVWLLQIIDGDDKQVDNGWAIISHETRLLQKTTHAPRSVVPMICVAFSKYSAMKSI